MPRPLSTCPFTFTSWTGVTAKRRTSCSGPYKTIMGFCLDRHPSRFNDWQCPDKNLKIFALSRKRVLTRRAFRWYNNIGMTIILV